MRLLKETLLLLWIVLVPFQHSGLQKTELGFLGASLSFIPGLLLLIIIIMEWLRGKNDYGIDRTLLFIVSYVIVVNVFYLMLFGIESHETNLVFKSINLSVLTGLLVLPIFFFDYDSPRLSKYIYLAFFVCLCGVVFTDLLAIDFVAKGSFFHAGESSNLRPRGFALESSTLSSLVVTLGLLSAHFAKRYVWKAAIIVLTLLCLIYSGSRGGPMVAILTAIFLALTVKLMHGYRKLVLIIAVVAATTLSYSYLRQKFITDFEMYTSTSTRVGLIVTSFNTLFHNPFGVGFAGFLPAVDRYAPGAIVFLDNLTGSTLNFTELESYIRSDTDINISTKTFLFDNLMYFGLPFLILFISFHRRLLKRLAETRKVYLAAGVLFSLIAVSTYIGALGMYNLSLLYGVAYSEIRRQEDSGGGA